MTMRKRLRIGKFESASPSGVSADDCPANPAAPIPVRRRIILFVGGASTNRESRIVTMNPGTGRSAPVLYRFGSDSPARKRQRSGAVQDASRGPERTGNLYAGKSSQAAGFSLLTVLVRLLIGASPSAKTTSGKTKCLSMVAHKQAPKKSEIIMNPHLCRILRSTSMARLAVVAGAIVLAIIRLASPVSAQT